MGPHSQEQALVGQLKLRPELAPCKLLISLLVIMSTSTCFRGGVGALNSENYPENRSILCRWITSTLRRRCSPASQASLVFGFGCGRKRLLKGVERWTDVPAWCPFVRRIAKSPSRIPERHDRRVITAHSVHPSPRRSRCSAEIKLSTPGSIKGVCRAKEDLPHVHGATQEVAADQIGVPPLKRCR